MSADTRNIVQASEIIQDTMADSNTVDASGDLLGYNAGNQGWLKVLRWLIGISKLLGELNRRHGATKWHGADVALTGTITSAGVNVTGSGTLFLSELNVGDFIAGTANEYRQVASITNDTSLTLVSAFTVDIGSGQAIDRLTTLAERLDYVNALRGQIFGRLIYNSTTLPPKVSAGTYEVAGKSIRVQADTALALTDVIGASKQGLDSFCWYWVVMLPDGTKKYVLAADSQIATGNITSITVVAGTATLTTSAAHGLSVGHIVTISGSGANDGKYKVLTTPTGTTLTYSTSSVTNTGAVGTWTGRARISHLHGTGASVNENTDANIRIFTPSPTFLPSLNGYYINQYGDVATTAVTAYARILGCFYTDTTPNVIRDIVSYGTGKEKNDNYIEADTTTVTTLVGAIFRYTIPTRFTKLWGNDYVATDDGTNAFRITASYDIDFTLSIQSYIQQSGGSGTGGANSIYENAAQVNEHRWNCSLAGTFTNSVAIPMSGVLYSASYIDFRANIVTATNGISTLTFRGKLA